MKESMQKICFNLLIGFIWILIVIGICFIVKHAAPLIFLSCLALLGEDKDGGPW